MGTSFHVWKLAVRRPLLGLHTANRLTLASHALETPGVTHNLFHPRWAQPASFSSLQARDDHTCGWLWPLSRMAIPGRQQLGPSVKSRKFANGTRDCKQVSCTKSGLAPAGDTTEKEKEKFLTIPTILTLARVAAVPALVTVFHMPQPVGALGSAAIFTLASITDWLDGYLARKMKSSSAFGAFLDPVADKLMVAAALVLICTKSVPALLFGVGSNLPWLLTVPAIAIIGREIAMSALREWAASQGGSMHEAVAVNSFGKWKTGTQMVSLTLLLLSLDSGVASLVPWEPTLLTLGVVLLYISAGLALGSFAVYLKAILQAVMSKG